MLSVNHAMRHDSGSSTSVCSRMEGLPPEALEQVAAYFQVLSEPRHGGVLPDRGRLGLRAVRSRLRQHRAKVRAHRVRSAGIRAAGSRRESTEARLSSAGDGKRLKESLLLTVPLLGP